ncbi:hypothetical protein [Clostridium sp.]|uniref:hypothetical protein n=1 Tax=Clostridium sp. TaxID=1506 RepID=UPI003D6D7773
MNIYNEQISNVVKLLHEEIGQRLETKGNLWQDVGKQNLVLRAEMSYELGAGTLPAVSFLGVTSSKELVPTDSALLCGKDLSQISTDTPYARITLLRINDELLGKGDAIYDAMRHLANTRYKVNPKGFMSRISTSNNHEPVRVSKIALEEGLSFSKVARLFLDAYKAHREVIAVQIIFVTLPNFNYGELVKLAQKNDQITTALDHILRDVKMDCASCKLQSICNEVASLV